MTQTINVTVSMAEVKEKLADPHSLAELAEAVGMELASKVQIAAQQATKSDAAAKSLGKKLATPLKAGGVVHEAAGIARPSALVRTAVVKQSEPTLQFKRLHKDAVIPSKSHPTDAGFDLVSIDRAQIKPGERFLTKTGVAVAIPEGFVGLVAPRSGLAVKHGISVTNAPGIVDSGYRGELMVIVHNLGIETFNIVPGDRIAQLVVTPFLRYQAEEVDELPEADRGEAGFGSTGR